MAAIELHVSDASTPSSSPSPQPPPCQERGKIVAMCMVLAVVTLTVYLKVGNHQFLSLDDYQYVVENPHVAGGITGKNIIWAFTSVDGANWHPITWLSHMVDAQLYGMNPRGHHLTSVIIHTAASLLLLLLLFRITGSLWRSSFVAALFALHPLHVESVAWVAERKDVLSAFFWFLTLLFYSEYAAKQRPALYILALFSFVLGLMSKPMLVTLPIILLLMDFWPLGRYRDEKQEKGPGRLSGRIITLVKEKSPFFACSLFSGVITIYAQHKGGATKSLDMIPFMLRIENALIACLKYIFKTLWPHDLAVLYPFPPSLPLWQAISSLLFLLFVSVATILVVRRFPYLAVGWFWYLVTLVPVIGLIQVGDQSMADRYTYIPVMGLFIMMGWGVPDLARGVKQRKVILTLLAGVAIIASAALTWHQLGYWRDSITLYRHTLDVTTGNYFIKNNLGVELAEKGDIDAAIREYQEALQIKPNFAEAHNNLGYALDIKGFPEEAILEYQEAIRISPNHLNSHNNLGVAFARKGNLDAAIQEYREALRINPNIAMVHNNLGFAFARKSDWDAAIQEYQAALQLDPNNAKARNNLGFALEQKRMRDEARE